MNSSLPEKKWFALGHHHQFGRGHGLGYDGFYFRLRAKFVFCSADKELGLCAVGEEAVAVLPPAGAHREPQRCHALDALVATAGFQANERTEGKAGEQDRPLVLLLPSSRVLRVRRPPLR